MPTLNLTALRWAGVLALFSCVLLYATSILAAACGCFGCTTSGACLLRFVPEGLEQSSGGDPEVPYAEFQLRNRPTFSSLDGFNNRRGEPMNITWGLVADNTPIAFTDGNRPSNLLAMLAQEYGASPGGIPQQPWFRLFESAFDRWSELSGVTFFYEGADGGAAIDATASPIGIPGVYPDVRIGGRPIDGATGANTLAFNYFPNHSDMVLDTDNAAFFGDRFLDSRRLRNTLMHEIGHGLGFRHLESNNSSQLMEPFITLAIDGPQIDDILAAHRYYGDALEKSGGNDLITTATPLGEFFPGKSATLGADGQAAVVNPDMVDFVSVDGVTDSDHYRFTVKVPTRVDITLTQVGRTYNEGPQNQPQTPLVTSLLNDLSLALQVAGGRNAVTLAEGTPTDPVPGEKIEQFVLLPGVEYFARVNGSRDNVQLYRLDLMFSIIPEPSGAALLAAFAWPVVGGRRWWGA